VLNKNKIVKLLSKIALAHKAEPYYRINTVASLQYYTDLQEDALGRTHKDVLDGYYWRRKQLTQADMKKSFGVMAIISHPVSVDALTNPKLRERRLDIICGFPLKCDGCPSSYQQSNESIDTLTANILVSFLSRLGEYHDYLVTIDGEDQEIVEHPSAISSYTVVDDYGALSKSNQVSVGGEISHFSMGDSGARYGKVSIRIVYCEELSQEFDINQELAQNHTPIVVCKSCT